MAKHASNNNALVSTGIASISALTVTAGALVALAPISSASASCQSDTANGVTGTLVEGGSVCELRFLPKDTDSNGSFDKVTWSFTAPAGVTKVSALVIAAGSAGSVSSTDYAAGGGAGQVKYVDDIGTSSRYLEVGIGEPVGGTLPGGGSWDHADDGYSSIGSTSGGSDLAESYAGFGSTASTSNTSGGDSGNSQAGGTKGLTGTPNAASGGGNAGPGSSSSAAMGTDISGGGGVAVQTFAEDATLWPSTFTDVFGTGGNYYAVAADVPSVVHGSGNGGHADGEANAYPGANGSIILRYAVSSSPEPAPVVSAVPYEGPRSLRLTGGDPCSNDFGFIEGTRLESIKTIYVDDLEVSHELIEETKIRYSTPDLEPGDYKLKMWVPVNSVYFVDQITIQDCLPSVSDEAEQPVDPDEVIDNPFLASRLFANYRGDIGVVVESDRLAITRFIDSFTGIQRVTCVGRTSGVPAISSDEALALARATNACGIVSDLVPDATVSLKTATGQGIGQKYRSVIIYVSGR